jgi:hypothetical protein
VGIAGGAVQLTVEVDSVDPVAVLVGAELEITEELTTTPPGPATEVVREPLSTYTPLK